MSEETEVSQPGLAELRGVVATYLPRLPARGSIRQDAIAGLNSAVSSAPDGMASSILAGVNPIYGLYACMFGPIAGGIFQSTRLMIVATTSAASLTAGQALAGLSGAERDNALFLMVILIGAFQVVFGLLGMGRLTRFVSYSVMTGFIIGIAVLTILSQLPTVTGYEPAAGANKVEQTFNLFADIGRVNPAALVTAIVTLALAAILPRTVLGGMGRLLAIAVPSIVVLVAGLKSVEIVKDVGDIAAGIPAPFIPSFSNISVDMVTGALSIAVIIVVQGAGVSQSVPNPDGSPRSISRDFIGQGAANLFSGFFHGLPVGGSLGSTALNVMSGARTRWASVFAGLWMAVLVVVFPKVVAYVAMPALGALLILASFSTIKPSEARSIWNTGWPSRLGAIATFLATLILPIQAAVGFGVVLSALLYVNESSTDILVVELVKLSGGRMKEREPAPQLSSNQVTILDVYGHLFYAGARTLERLLPTPEGANQPVVILRLRGRQSLGATLIEVLETYAEKIQDANGRLYLTGVSDEAYEQIVRTDKLRAVGAVLVREATPIRGESTDQAYADATAWLAGQEAKHV